MFNLSECPAKRDPELWQWIDAEAKRQEQNIELIASENYASPAVMAAQGLSGQALLRRLRIC